MTAIQISAPAAQSLVLHTAARQHQRKIYQVEVTDFEGEVHFYEIESRDASRAADMAADFCLQDGISADYFTVSPLFI